MIELEAMGGGHMETVHCSVGERAAAPVRPVDPAPTDGAEETEGVHDHGVAPDMGRDDARLIPQAVECPLPQATTATSPQPVTIFAGVPEQRHKLVYKWPPDTNGTVGIDQWLFQPANNFVQVTNLKDKSKNSFMSLNNFWNQYDPGVSAFDPRVVYDAIDNRFVFVSLTGARSASSELLISFSKSSDPSGDWANGKVPVAKFFNGSANDLWLDFPTLGLTSDKVIVCLNVFSISTNQSKGVAMVVFDKASFYASPYSGPYTTFASSTGSTLFPALTGDPGVADSYLLATESSATLGLYKVSGDFTGNGPVFSSVGQVPTNFPYSSGSGSGDIAPQKDSSTKIDTGDWRMGSVKYRNGSIWFAHTVLTPGGGPTRASAEWGQISPAGQLIQNGLVDDPTGANFYAYPSIAVNKNNDVLVGFATFSASIHPSGAYAYRNTGDPPSTLRKPYVYADGKIVYYQTGSGGTNRWGDYSSTVVDPPDGPEFWTLQEMSLQDQSTWTLWGTMWANVPAPN